MQQAEVLFQGFAGSFGNQIPQQGYDLAVEDESIEVVGVELRCVLASRGAGGTAPRREYRRPDRTVWVSRKKGIQGLDEVIEGLDIRYMAAIPKQSPLGVQAASCLAGAFDRNRIIVSVDHQGRDPELDGVRAGDRSRRDSPRLHAGFVR